MPESDLPKFEFFDNQSETVLLDKPDKYELYDPMFYQSFICAVSCSEESLNAKFPKKEEGIEHIRNKYSEIFADNPGLPPDTRIALEIRQ